MPDLTISGPTACRLAAAPIGPWFLANADGTKLPPGAYLTLAYATWNLELGTLSGPVRCEVRHFDQSGDRLVVVARRVRAAVPALAGYIPDPEGGLLNLDDLRRRVLSGALTMSDARAMLAELERLYGQ